MTFEIIQRNFSRRLWNAAMVALAVEKGIISPEQYEEITGLAYPTQEAQAEEVQNHV